MRIILIGAPGSGKSVVSAALTKSLNIPAISIGQKLRELAKSNGSEDAKAARQALNTGELVPDELAVRLLKEELERVKPPKGFILDGLPRTFSEARLIEGMFPVNRVFHLKVSPSIAFQRLMLRGRSDDVPSRIQRRIDIYQENIGEILSFYRSRGLLVEADASSDIQSAAREVMSKLQ
ncbi:MAG: Adenylate kinase [candidate division CPR1 bacterium GW2011_GWC1_49_13]|uniref:Adenylate kinase n=1 Tax=candidate division CPR1 bacterium GW2011_GWC1_49_13 TaxID=1618342 RepID=A0A0G1XTS4_9BACT|nr:MAG: Adenylate kinase [candidate division CPR1 bacterium GW2011_GWC1_49_13]